MRMSEKPDRHDNHLLVIDWDYFFPNPVDGGDYKEAGRTTMLYDWGHKEAPFFIDDIWGTRAMAFLHNDLPLPYVNDEWKTFLSRFKFTDDVKAYYAESNMESGGLSNPYGGSFDSVWLYDAHHDSGYHYDKMAQFVSAGQYSCEDWMLIHAIQGAELHVQYPQWKKYWAKEAKPPKDLKIDRAMDKGKTPNLAFNTVFVCRSGAWVPPWSDDAFFEFLKTLPGDDLEEMGSDTYPCVKRAFSMAEAEEQAANMKRMIALIEQDARGKVE